MKQGAIDQSTCSSGDIDLATDVRFGSFAKNRATHVNRCPLLAQSRHEQLHRTCPLSGVKRTSRLSGVKRTFEGTALARKNETGRRAVREQSACGVRHAAFRCANTAATVDDFT